MGSSKIALGLLLTCAALDLYADETIPTSHHHTSAFSDKPPAIKSKILFLTHKGHIDEALDLYEEYRQITGKDDFEVLQQLCLSLLEQGSRTKDDETMLLTIFGAGISMNEKALPILEAGIESNNPKIQLIAINFLAKQQNDAADDAIASVLSSPYLLLRLEAVYALCKKKHPQGVAQAEALMNKVDDSIKPLFPIIFGEEGSPHAMRIFRKLMSDPDDDVRVASIISAMENKRDDLLPKIRILVAQHNVGQQEACAMAIGLFHDEKSIPKLEVLARSTSTTVRLAAAYALYKLGKKEYVPIIYREAKDEDPFAITLLGDVEGAQDFLYQLTQSQDIQVRVNSAIALLKHRDIRSAKPVLEVLIEDPRELGFTKITSNGKALSAWKVTPSRQSNFEDTPIAHELSIALREEVLTMTLELPEKMFIQIANLILDTYQHDLVPRLMTLLENMRSPDAVALLKKHQQKFGAPLIRNYCTLALYRLKEPGPYADILRQWIMAQKDIDLIRFRQFLPLEERETKSNDKYQLTPEETSLIYIEALEALARNQDEKGIRILIHTIRQGNSKNKYALAGLLLHAIQ